MYIQTLPNDDKALNIISLKEANPEVCSAFNLQQDYKYSKCIILLLVDKDDLMVEFVAISYGRNNLISKYTYIKE